MSCHLFLSFIKLYISYKDRNLENIKMGRIKYKNIKLDQYQHRKSG